jgi:hypothetical protein
LIDLTVLAVSVPFSLENGTVTSLPSTKYPVIFTASFDGSSDVAVAPLRASLSAGHAVEIDVHGSEEENWERLEDLLTKATADGLDTGLVILCESFKGVEVLQIELSSNIICLNKQLISSLPRTISTFSL